MMWMQHLPHLCKMAPCMSGCCVNLGLFAAGMVCLFGGTRQMCGHVLSATLQASKYYSLLCTRLHLITQLVGVNNLKLFRVGLHICAMDCNPRVQLIHMCMLVYRWTAIPESNCSTFVCLCSNGLQCERPGYPREKSGNTHPGTTVLWFWV